MPEGEQPRMSDGAGFAAWPLHDALLHSVHLDWEARRCVIVLDAFLDQRREAKPCQIEFESVTSLHVPCKTPWAPSVSINGQSVKGRDFVIEMQSGDEIHVEADHARLVQR